MIADIRAVIAIMMKTIGSRVMVAGSVTGKDIPKLLSADGKSAMAAAGLRLGKTKIAAIHALLARAGDPVTTMEIADIATAAGTAIRRVIPKLPNADGNTAGPPAHRRGMTTTIAAPRAAVMKDAHRADGLATRGDILKPPAEVGRTATATELTG
jgi:hypothetical protein